jgi:uncharacterized protein YhjY with autotransporter beta-barrel domain
MKKNFTISREFFRTQFFGSDSDGNRWGKSAVQFCATKLEKTDFDSRREVRNKRASDQRYGADSLYDQYVVSLDASYNIYMSIPLLYKQ